MLTIILSMIGVLGLGAGIWTVASALSAPRTDAFSLVAALAAGSVPFAIGTIALGAVAIVLAIEKASRDQIAAINRGTEVAINEARHAPHHQAARQPHHAP
ncbi:MAG TPA: hypothetical protein VF469_24705 [Kofleriaceae bacterium]